MRAVLETDMTELTAVSNTRLLRHHEVRQSPLVEVDHVDYFFHRYFALIEACLRPITATRRSANPR